MNSNEILARIDELLDAGWTIEERTRYLVFDPQGDCVIDVEDDEYGAWERTINRLERQYAERAKERLARWNAAVRKGGA